ncbi:hypothetical protein HZB03_01535 [Candidatus Woesearchaeota archaeon]|nr:hypothetical protein [Candidatus Woesearchaeota archaeon]
MYNQKGLCTKTSPETFVLGSKARPSGRSFWHAKNAAFADPHETPAFKSGLCARAAFLSFRKAQSSTLSPTVVIVVTVVFIILLLVIVGVYVIPRVLNPSG